VSVPPNLNDETAAMFALQTPTGVYSPRFPGYLGSLQPFTQTSAPVRTGIGPVVDPWTVTSTSDATSSLHITQTVTHVDGTTEFLGTWAVHNSGGASVNLEAFEGGDLYVSENDNGFGSVVGTSPNRIAQSVATDGTTAELIEQSSAPWSHYGETGEQIAAAMYLSPETIRTHLRNTMRKLEASTRVQAVAIALRDGEITAA
jgi:hypothetical protein